MKMNVETGCNCLFVWGIMVCLACYNRHMANIETGDSIEYGSRLKTRSSNVNSFGLFFVIRPFLF